MTRKLILFLVEGITEEISFGLIFSEIFEDKEIEFQIARGDITMRNGVNYRNLKVEKAEFQINVRCLPSIAVKYLKTLS